MNGCAFLVILGCIWVMTIVWLGVGWGTLAFFLLAAIPVAALAFWQANNASTTPAVQGSPTRRAIPQSVRHEVWRRDQGRCVECGSRERLEFDHIVPISKGGSNTARNIELRCEFHNRSKAATI